MELTSGEAARLVRVHPTTIQRWSEAGLVYRTTPGGHRRITLDDLIRFAREKDELPAEFDPDTREVYEGIIQVDRDTDWSLLASLVYEWAEQGQPAYSGRLLQLLVELDRSLAVCLDELFAPVLYRIGTCWEEGTLSIGDQHRMVSRLEDALHEFRCRRIRANSSTASPRAIVAGVESNYHSMGALMVRIILESMGWHVAYLGTGVPSEEVARQQRQVNADLVCISTPRPSIQSDAMRTINVLRSQYESSSPYRLVLGGGGISSRVDENVSTEPFEELRLFDRLEDLGTWVRTLSPNANRSRV